MTMNKKIRDVNDLEEVPLEKCLFKLVDSGFHVSGQCYTKTFPELQVSSNHAHARIVSASPVGS